MLLIGGGKLVAHLICWKTWLEVPVTIESVRLDEIPGSGSNPNLQVITRYSFSVDGKSHFSEQMDFFGSSGSVHGDPAEAEMVANEIRQSPPKTCRVAPSDPTRSALFPKRELDFSIVIFSMGVIFLIGFFWGSLVRIFSRGRDPAGASIVRDLLPVLVVPVLLTVLFPGLLIVQWLEEKDAEDWIETPATIVASDFSYNDGWEPVILYEWVGADGESHRSNQISFASFYGSVLEVDRLVTSLPPGHETVCYVDPDNRFSPILRRRYGMNNSGVFLMLSIMIMSWYAVFYYWRFVRKLPTRHVFAWFHWKSPLVPLAVAFLYGAGPDISREIQLGVFMTIYQMLAIGAVVILIACGCLLFMASKYRSLNSTGSPGLK